MSSDASVLLFSPGWKQDQEEAPLAATVKVPETSYSFCPAEPQHDLEALRGLHRANLAEAIERSGCSPEQLIETLLKVGNQKVMEGFRA